LRGVRWGCRERGRRADGRGGSRLGWRP
jgi:hypothetical protein